MLRSVLSVLFGVLGGALIVFATERISHVIYPIPAGFDPMSATAIAGLPFGAKAAVIIAWFAGAFGGGVIASLVSKRWAPAACVVAATMLLFAATNFSAFPHPLWMMIASAAATAAGGYLAVRATSARFGRPPTATVAKKSLI
jgi:hypothetical protein